MIEYTTTTKFLERNSREAPLHRILNIFDPRRKNKNKTKTKHKPNKTKHINTQNRVVNKSQCEAFQISRIILFFQAIKMWQMNVTYMYQHMLRYSSCFKIIINVKSIRQNETLFKSRGNN